MTKPIRWSQVDKRVREAALRLTGGSQDHITIVSKTQVYVDKPLRRYDLTRRP